MIAGVVSAVLLAAASSARAEEPAAAASPHLRLNHCIDDEARARAARVTEARKNGSAFRQSGVWLPPFYLTDAERSYTWAGLLYFSVSDFDDDTTTRALVPAVFSFCTPESDTLVTPVYSYRHDADGTAGFILDYFFRRDRLREADVLFPFFWSIRSRPAEGEPFSSSAGALPPFVWWGRNESGDHHFFVPPLYWNWGDSTTSSTVLLNAYWHTEPKRWDAGVVPFYFGGDDGTSRYTLIPPLLFYRGVDPGGSTTWVGNTIYTSRPDGYSLTVLPVLFMGRSSDSHYTLVPPLVFEWGDAEAETLIAGPVFHRRRGSDWSAGVLPFWVGAGDGTSRWDLVPPLFLFHEGDPSGSTTYALQTYYQSRPTGYTLASFPFVFSGRDDADHYTVIPPLLFVHAGDATNELTWAGPVYYRKAPDRYDLGVVPLYFTGRHADAYYDIAPPFFFSKGDANEQTLLAGLYYAHTDAEKWARAVFPFWLAYGSGNTRTDLIPPLLFVRSAEFDQTTYWVGQTYYQSRPDGFSLASLPLLFAGKDYTSSYLVVPPLVWHFADDQGSTTVAGDVYYVKRPEGYDLGVVPFYFRGRHGADHYDLVPPLYFNWGDGTTSTTLVGPGYYHSALDGYDLGVAPIYFRGRHDNGFYDIAFPFFARWGDRETTHAAFLPGYYVADSVGWDAGVIPFWFGGSDGLSRYDLVPPLLFFRNKTPEELKVYLLNTWYDRTATDYTLASFPFLFAWGGQGEHHVLVPPLLAYHGGNGVSETTYAVQTYYHSDLLGYDLGVMPFYFRGRHGPSHYDLAPPFFWNWGDSTSSTTIVGPAYEARSSDGWAAGVAPFWIAGGDATSRFDLVPPLLFFHSSSADRQQTYLINTWYESRGRDYTLASVPFVFAGREGESHYALVPPVFWNWGDAQRSTTIAGPAFYHHSPEGYDLGVAPFYFRGRDTVGGYYDFAPPLFWRWGDDAHHTTIAGPVIAHTDPDGWDAGVLPFWMGGTSGTKHFDLVPPLLFYRSTDSATGASTTFLINTLYRSHGSDYSLTSFPFVFADREGDSRALVILPLLFDFQDAESRTTVVGNVYRSGDATGWSAGVVPFWFGARHGDQAYDLVPPLFFHSRDGDHSRTTLLPLFDYQTSPGEKTLLSLPFIYSTDPTHERTEVLGLYWHFLGPDADDRVIFPFWWDFHDTEKHTRLTTVFPFYWQYEKPDETTHLLLNVMWSEGQTAKGPSWSLHVFPLVDLVSYHPQHFLWQVLGGLVGSEREGDQHRNRFVWVWTDPTTDAPR